HYRVAFDAERAVEDDGVAVDLVARRVLVRLVDQHARFAAVGWHGTRERDANVFLRRVRIAYPACTRDRAVHDVEPKRLARGAVDDALVAGNAPSPDRVEVVARTR